LVWGKNAAQSLILVSIRGVGGVAFFVLGHAPSLWKVWATVNAIIDDTVKSFENETMVMRFNGMGKKVNWQTSRRGHPGTQPL
jgi:hypothetical protein